MTRDKQLRCIKLDAVQAKQSLGQALNIKEFAVLAGIAYSVARDWFQIPGFPEICGKVFWDDFVDWRRTRKIKPPTSSKEPTGSVPPAHTQNFVSQLPPKAAQILANAK